MTDVSFYHLTTSPLEHALPKLMERVYGSGEKAVLLTESEEQASALNDLLWNYSTESFLPHGMHKDGNDAEQPIYITPALENPNEASILVVTQNNPPESIDDFSRCLYMFNGDDNSSLIAARAQWRSYKDLGHALTYWQQDAKGSWKKAT